MRLPRIAALALALLPIACTVESVDDFGPRDDDPMGDSVDVSEAGSIGVRVPSSLNLDRSRKFYLTFDDGPSAQYTPQILATLRAHNAPATFFVTGVNIAGNEAILRDIVARGHLLASHQWSHVNASVANFRLWVPRQATLLDTVVGSPVPRLFRYPYGAGSAEKETILRANGYGHGGIGWDVDTLDWCYGGNNGRCDRASAQYRNDYVGWTVSEAARRGGGVILFHDIQGITARNLDTILTQLEGMGFTFAQLPSTQPMVTPPTVTPTTVTTCTVSAETANVRNRPDGDVVGTLMRGATVSVRGASGDWYSVRYTLAGAELGTDSAPRFMHRTVMTCR
jgi:peptidoglycan/xylan/chitin deacetylase (PgdA/CDA1 family)